MALAIAELPEKERPIRKVARRLGQDYAAVWRWLNEGKLPEYQGRKAANTHLDVGLDDWDLPPSQQLNKKLSGVFKTRGKP